MYLQLAYMCVLVVAGRDLLVMDPNGKSDPYCVVTVGDQEEKTCVQYSTVNPEWRETLHFPVTGVPQLMQTEPGTCSVKYTGTFSQGSTVKLYGFVPP